MPLSIVLESRESEVFRKLPGRSPHAAERRSVGRLEIDTLNIFSLFSELALALAGFAGSLAAQRIGVQRRAAICRAAS
jgi:hypothetical protein